MTTILAIDPGTTESGWCRYGLGKVIESGVEPNDAMLTRLYQRVGFDLLAIEMVASYGMAVGREVFETCVWIGRFQQQFAEPGKVRLVYRKDVKLHLCGSPRAKDSNIRQALIDRLGAPGTKRAPGGTYGVKSHAWPALAVAVTVSDSLPRPAAVLNPELLEAF
ncbi:hypothetical protein [Caldimonas sp. KR1-144]|uniref:hypothetical protein n=1 Tax=Caldimonas sp. KR1-144 TaxID=3400911 RepID=UPI003C10500F